MISPDIIACAIVAAGRACGQDPKRLCDKRLPKGGYRYYAVRLLYRLLSITPHRPDPRKVSIALCIGYSPSVANGMLAPSTEGVLRFNVALFDRAWIEFTRLLERFAPEALEAEAPSLTRVNSSCVGVPPPSPPPPDLPPSPSARPARKPAPPLILDTDPESARIAEKSRLRSMIDQAFANTPGAVKV